MPEPQTAHSIYSARTADGYARTALPDMSSPENRSEQCTRTYKNLLLQKEREISELRAHMALRIKEVTDARDAHEQIMIHQARHAAMGEMLGAIAHQWRQPLNLLSLVVQNIKESYDYNVLTKDALDECVSTAMEQIMFMSHTIDDFRNFFHPRVTGEQFCPYQSIEEAVSLMSGWFATLSDINVSIKTDENYSVTINGCANRFKQVILNLLCNAKDSIEERLRHDNAMHCGCIAVRIFPDNSNTVCIDVEDNGSGINTSIINRIFEPYFSTKEQTGGSGIGLYVSRLIIENSMSGSLTACNTDMGALFRIKLPAAVV